MTEVTDAPTRAKQDFTVGNTVRIGGSMYRVTGRKPAPAKGEAPVVELISLDLERRYEWQPFRGLRVIGGSPKRIRKRRPKGARSGVQRVQKVSLWSRVIRAIRRH